MDLMVNVKLKCSLSSINSKHNISGSQGIFDPTYPTYKREVLKNKGSSPYRFIQLCRLFECLQRQYNKHCQIERKDQVFTFSFR